MRDDPCRFALACLLGCVGLACGTRADPGDAYTAEDHAADASEGSGGDGDDPDTGDSRATSEDGTAVDDGVDDTDDDGGTSAGASCPEPPVAPELDPSATDRDCPPDFVLDRAYLLCVADQLAAGPFAPAMVDACQDCGGEACGDAIWPADQARALRGTDECPPGTDLVDALCVDAGHAWGPFPPALVVACRDAGGGAACDTLRWDRGFAEALWTAAQPATFPWTYILDTDLGVRDDAYGGGHFGAPRNGNPGGHSGIDFLAPLQTSLRAPCDGPVLAGYANGYGNYVQLACAVPPGVSRGGSVYASLFFAHLDSLAVDSGATVTAGQVVGTVGKTGNASAAPINPHVHFEIAIHASEAAALGETHASANHGGNAAADQFALDIAAACWGPEGLSPLTGPSMKGRRPDPFMVLACLSDKPALQSPGALQALGAWSDHYDAAFDVDEGL
ncbi:MAG: M23 family metallopeptidase [Myxococcota bacterium]